MPYDVFVSYSRRDNNGGLVTRLVERIARDFEAIAHRPLVPFFDGQAIEGMDDWRHNIFRGLRESRLLLACLSPSYLASEYCQWEFVEYLRQAGRYRRVGVAVSSGWRGSSHLIKLASPHG